MNKFILILLLIIYQNLQAQTDYFNKVQNVDTIEYTNNIEGFELQNAFRYNEYIFLIGYTYDTKVENMGKRLFIINQKGEIIFKSEGQLDSYYFEPYFYQSKNDPGDFIIIAESGAEYSWGAQGYYIKNNKLYKLGYLDVGVLNKEYINGKIFFTHPSRINKYLIITENNNDIYIKFKGGEILVLYPGSDKESRIESEKVYYKWNGINLDLIVKS